MLDSVTGMTSRNADHLDLERFSSVAILEKRSRSR